MTYKVELTGAELRHICERLGDVGHDIDHQITDRLESATASNSGGMREPDRITLGQCAVFGEFNLDTMPCEEKPVRLPDGHWISMEDAKKQRNDLAAAIEWHEARKQQPAS